MIYMHVEYLSVKLIGWSLEFALSCLQLVYILGDDQYYEPSPTTFDVVTLQTPREHYLFFFVCLLVCFGSVTAFVLRDQIPREDLQRAPLPPRSLVIPGPYLSSCSLSPPPPPPPPPHTFVMHPASGQYLPLSSCPVHIS